MYAITLTTTQIGNPHAHIFTTNNVYTTVVSITDKITNSTNSDLNHFSKFNSKKLHHEPI